MVKQFSNAGIDNIFKFFFKIVDFGKVLLEVFISFLEIWFTFIMIFWNFLMFIYYLFLFMIDRSADESYTTVRFWKKRSHRVSRTPSISPITGPNPVPAMYRATKTVATSAASAASAVKTTTSPFRGSPSGSGAKRSFFKSTFEFFRDFFITIAKVVAMPFISIGRLFQRKIKPVKERDSEESKSLIDEYMQEYKLKRK